MKEINSLAAAFLFLLTGTFALAHQPDNPAEIKALINPNAFTCKGSAIQHSGSTGDAKSPCGTVTLPLVEGFNDYGMPACWTQEYLTGTSDLAFVDSSIDPETGPQEGNSYVYWNSYDINSGDETRLVSRLLTTSGINSVDVAFYWMVDGSSEVGNADGVYVEYSTDGIVWTTVGSMIPQYDPDFTGWKLKTIVLPSGAGNQDTLYVGFRFYSNYGYNCSFDNLVISEGSSIIWTGNTDSDWNTGSNWSSGTVPLVSDNVIIPDVTNNPVVNGESFAPAVCNDITLETGAVLTVASGKALTVNGTFTNNSGTSGLVVHSDGSLIENTFGVAATVADDISAGTDVWQLFISPLTESIEASSASYFNTAFLDRYNEPSGEWIRLLTGDFLLPDNGYSINFPEGIHSLLYSGTLKSSPAEFADLSYTAGAPGYLAGWNLVGNPYPCSLDLTLCTLTGGLNAFAYVWNGANYDAYSIGVTNKYFAFTVSPTEGFFVRTFAGSSSLTLENAAKTHGVFSKNAEVIRDMLKISVSGNGYSDQTFVRFNESATSGFDQDLDAYKLFGKEAAPQLYSLLPGDNAAINTLPFIETDPHVSLGFKAGTENTYTLTVAGIESFDTATPLFLEDVKTNSTVNLRQNPLYSFTAVPGDPEHRFNLHFKNATGIDEPVSCQVGIYSNQHFVFVNNPDKRQGNIAIYDIAGRLLMSNQLSGNILNKMDVGTYSGNLLVKVITAKGITTGKVFIN